jgi:hypothetical protein
LVGIEETLDIQALWRAGRSGIEIAGVTGTHRQDGPAVDTGGRIFAARVARSESVA